MNQAIIELMKRPIRLAITDQFNIFSYGLNPGTFRDISISQLTSAEATNFLHENEGYYNEPHLQNDACKKIFTQLLECDISKNRPTKVCLDGETVILYITMENKNKPLFYLITEGDNGE